MHPCVRLNPFHPCIQSTPLHAERVQNGGGAGACANIFMNIKQSLLSHALTRGEQQEEQKQFNFMCVRVCSLWLLSNFLCSPDAARRLWRELRSICPSINKTANLNILSLHLREWSHSVRGRSSGSLGLICIIIESSDAGVFLGAKLIMRRLSFKYDPLAVYFVCDADCWAEFVGNRVGGNWYCLIYWVGVHPTAHSIKISYEPEQWSSLCKLG